MQTRKLKTKCEICGREIGNSGLRNHMKTHEKKPTPPADPDPETPEPETQPEPKKEKKDKTPTVRIIEDTAGEKKGLDKLAESLAKFIEKHDEELLGLAAAVGAGYANAKTQPSAQIDEPKKSPYGEW